MKKRLLAVILGAAMIMSMAACGGGKEEAAAASKLDAIKEAGVLKVSTSPDFAPYEFEDPSQTGQDVYVGSDMALARYIAEQLGVECEIVPMDFDACLAGVTQDKVDISIAAFYPSEERKMTVDFTDPYFDDSRQVVVIKKENMDKFKTAADFEDQKIAAQNGSAQAGIAEEQVKGQVELVNKTSDGIQMVKTDKCVGIVLQAVMAESVISSDDSLAIATPEYKAEEAELVVAVKKEQAEFMEELNKIVKGVNDGELYGQWLVDAQNLAQTITAE